MMEIQITALSENTATHGFLSELGLSLLVEAGGKKILWDTGMSISAAYNAALLNIDLSTIDVICLSHGHVDHTGGLREILRRSKSTDVIAHPDIKASKYARRSPTEYQYIGIPYTFDELESCGANFIFSREPFSLTENITTSGEVAMTSDYEIIEDNLLVKESGKYVPDDLLDDLSLIINTLYGLVVICGCAHRGVINTLRHAQKLTGNDLIYAVMGGIHLVRAEAERIERTIADLKEIGVQTLYTSHCTGSTASMRLAQEFGSSFIPLHAGMRVSLP